MFWHLPAIPNKSALCARAIAGAMFFAPQSAWAAQTFECVIDAAETIKLGSPIPGILSEVSVKRGDRVERGQKIAALESSIEQATVRLNELRATSNARIIAQTERLNLASAKLRRITELYNKNVSTLEKFDELRTEKSVLEQDLLKEKQEKHIMQLELERSVALLQQRTILSPINGIITEKKLSAGEFISQEGYVAMIARLNPLHVEVFLPTQYYPHIRMGMTAKVYPAAPINGEYEAKVIVVDRVFDPSSSTFGVRLEMSNPDHVLPGGQRCKIDLEF